MDVLEGKFKPVSFHAAGFSFHFSKLLTDKGRGPPASFCEFLLFV